jgi:pimeloyl-ACP methyl ester carboxylesterase
MVLIHGAFGRAANWDRVVPGLRAAGHDVEAIDLPGAGDDRTPIAEVTLDRYAERVCEVLAAGPPAVLVGHSMGGMVITQAAARCPERIARLVYVTAFVPWDGVSLIDLTRLPEAAGDQIQANMIVEGDPPVARMSPEGARQARYGCCNEEQVAYALARNSPQAVAPFTHPVRLNVSASDAFAALPRAYVMCLQDMAVRPPLQRLMLERAGCDPVIEIDTDHAVWASRPEELAAALNRLAAPELGAEATYLEA